MYKHKKISSNYYPEITTQRFQQFPSHFGLCVSHILFKNKLVQWLRLHTSNAGGMGLIPGWGTKIPHAVRCGQKKKSILYM